MLAHVYDSFVKTGPSISYVTGTAAPTSSRTANFASLTMTVDSATNPRSFLASAANFEFVEDMQSRNMIVPIVGDFAGPQALRAVGPWLRERATTVSAFYVSNVEQYLFRPVR
jgi:hypothetical protein